MQPQPDSYIPVLNLKKQGQLKFISTEIKSPRRGAVMNQPIYEFIAGFVNTVLTGWATLLLSLS